MKHRKQLKEASRIVEKYCIIKGEKFRLKDYDPADTNGVKSKQHAENILERRIGLLSDMQEKLYAQRSEEHTSELQSHHDLVCRLLLEKKKKTNYRISTSLKYMLQAKARNP